MFERLVESVKWASDKVSKVFEGPEYKFDPVTCRELTPEESEKFKNSFVLRMQTSTRFDPMSGQRIAADMRGDVDRITPPSSQ